MDAFSSTISIGGAVMEMPLFSAVLTIESNLSINQFRKANAFWAPKPYDKKFR